MGRAPPGGDGARRRGAKAQARGKEFEQLLGAHHQAGLLMRLIASVEHNQPEARVLRGRVIFAGASVADFTGLLRGGLYFANELKSTAEPEFYRRKIPDKQQAHLDAVADAGGLALFSIEFREEQAAAIYERRRFVLPWREVPWRSRATSPAITAEDLNRRGWRLTGPCYLLRFVEQCPACRAARRSVTVGAAGFTFCSCRITPAPPQSAPSGN